MDWRMNMSRRRLLALGAGAGTAALAAGWVILGRRPGDMAVDFLRRALPGVRFDEAGLARYRAEIDGIHPRLRSRARIRIYELAEPITGIVPGPLRGLSQKKAYLERDWLSRFLIRSDFFYVDPQKNVVTYTGELPRACPNPFVRQVETL